MKAILILLFSSLLLMKSNSCLADSPLTSTDFCQAYNDEPMVLLAKSNQGKLSKELMEYLILDNRPLDIKIAIINQLGWQIEGYENAKDFMQYLIVTKRFSSSQDFYQRASGDLLLCMAYLKAMDNYFSVDEALKIAKKAKEKSPNSYITHIICALIEAQKIMENDWCEVYKISNEVRLNNTLHLDIKPEAIKIIFDYMDLYQEECLSKN